MSINDVDYIDYFKNTNIIYNLKINDLKKILKKNNLKLTGKKIVLIDRVKEYFNTYYSLLNTKIIKIQKMFRSYIVRLSFKLRGEKECINNTDFYTLELLKDISFKRYFSFKDSKGFIYGCDIFSLEILLKNSKNTRFGKIRNPYNRDDISLDTIYRMLNLLNIIKIIYPNVENIKNVNEISFVSPRLILITNIRKKTLNERIIELFTQIDILGNYTQYSWFNNLNKREYYRLFRSIKQLWDYSARIPQNIKQKICVYSTPYVNVYMPEDYIQLSIEDLQNICLTVMENIIYTGIDDEYKKIGALHVLSALTIVSIEARNNLPYLYESLNI
jgi:hypothetical protein